MKRLVVIAFLLYAGVADAQSLSRKRIDRHSGDTTQFTRAWTLYDPLTERLLNWGYTTIRWSIEKISPKAHHGDTTLLYLQIEPNADFTLTRDSSLLEISFANGHTLRLPSSFLQLQIILGVTDQVYKSSSLLAAYPLTASDIHSLITETIVSARFHTTKGPANFTIGHANALRLQRKLSGLASNSQL